MLVGLRSDSAREELLKVQFPHAEVVGPEREREKIPMVNHGAHIDGWRAGDIGRIDGWLEGWMAWLGRSLDRLLNACRSSVLWHIKTRWTSAHCART